MSIRQLYNHYLGLYRKDVRIRHVKLNNRIDGYFEMEGVTIYIKSDLAYKKEGLITLHHEYQHFLQWKSAKYKDFFDVKMKKFTKKRFERAVFIEQEAGRFAQTQMRKDGLKYNAEELDKKKLTDLKKFWREDYFL